MPRTALVTGGNAGLGLEFAHQLAARGDRLVLVARRADKLEAAKAAILERAEVEVHTLAGDLADPDCPRQLFEQVSARGLEVDILINNAGSAGPHLLDDRDWEANAAWLELMTTSVAHMCHRFIPGMRERGYGRVINVASMAGRITRVSGANYGPAKAYVIALSEELALLCKDSGVHVSALCPGFTHTDFHASAGLDDFKSSLPGWMWYEAADVVREGLDAVEQGRAVMPSGRLYRVVDPVLQSPVFKRITRLLPGTSRPTRR